MSRMLAQETTTEIKDLPELINKLNSEGDNYILSRTLLIIAKELSSSQLLKQIQMSSDHLNIISFLCKRISLSVSNGDFLNLPIWIKVINVIKAKILNEFFNHFSAPVDAFNQNAFWHLLSIEFVNITTKEINLLCNLFKNLISDLDSFQLLILFSHQVDITDEYKEHTFSLFLKILFYAFMSNMQKLTIQLIALLDIIVGKIKINTTHLRQFLALQPTLSLPNLFQLLMQMLSWMSLHPNVESYYQVLSMLEVIFDHSDTKTLYKMYQKNFFKVYASILNNALQNNHVTVTEFLSKYLCKVLSDINQINLVVFFNNCSAQKVIRLLVQDVTGRALLRQKIKQKGGIVTFNEVEIPADCLNIVDGIKNIKVSQWLLISTGIEVLQREEQNTRDTLKTEEHCDYAKIKNQCNPTNTARLYKAIHSRTQNSAKSRSQTEVNWLCFSG